MNPRTRQTDRTRNAIIETAIELMLSGSDPATFTMQAVADGAGVSHRTLYRYFAGRQELIDACGAHMDSVLVDAAPFDPVPSFDDWISNIAAVVAFGATHRETFRKTAALSVSSGVWRSDRDECYWQLFRERFPHLDEDVARQDFAVLRSVYGANSTVLVGERFGLSPEALVPALERAVADLLTAITARDEAAARENTDSDVGGTRTGS